MTVGDTQNGLGKAAIERLLNPQSIAILGASPERDSIGGGVLSNLESFGYKGAIHLVSRSRDEINGRPCVKTIAELPRDIDVAVLIVPHKAISSVGGRVHRARRPRDRRLYFGFCRSIGRGSPPAGRTGAAVLGRRRDAAGA
ncbi:CoA-binding protein [Pararhodobacter zhoushanensis]|uniref:CoA-binding protein n=1 Tax=Pararhodobacter zhoushanensis TaxID=2479545 RepID=A0ABT3GT75_9RHOB|nr:CoA-binding protein [Pararhodobacter zhoushanensis]MCW1930745.1 CoA-binding protein [Pararhodobacter zhoushanensis]